MQTPLSDFGLYAILTSPLRGYTYCAEAVTDAGIRFLQLRIKDQPLKEIARIAEQIRKITENTSTLFIINDHPEIARDCNADGVHIGQDDMPVEHVREIIGNDKVIGLSTHNPVQTEEACRKHPSYIGVGPVFPTPTKKNPDPVIGIDGMQEMLKKATVPAIAIGGITLSNLPAVFTAGARNFCMVREITQSEDPAGTLSKILHIYRDFYPERT